MNSQLLIHDNEKNIKTASSFVLLSIVAVIGAVVELADYCTEEVKLAVLLAVWLYAVLLGLIHIRERFAYFVFVCLLYVFLISRPSLAILFDIDWKYWKEGTLDTVFAIIYVSIIALIFAVKCKSLYYSKQKTSPAISIKNENSKMLHRLVRLLLVVSALAYYYVQIRIYFSQRFSDYESLYLEHAEVAPFVIRAMAGLFTAAVAVALALMPNKRETIAILLLYSFSGMPLFLLGNRTALILPVVFCVVYYMTRAQLENEETVWISKKMAVAFFIVMILAVVVLGAMNYSRDDKNVSYEPRMPLMADFFYKQGTTFDTVCQGIEYKDVIESLPGDPIYSTSEIVDTMKFGRIGRLVNDYDSIPSGNNIQVVYNKSSLAHRLSYIVLGPYYLAGHGRGSSYILENYLDWGLAGVFIVSFLLGTFLLNISTLLEKHGIIIRMITISCIMNIFIIPRAESTVFLSFLFSPYYWMVFIMAIVIIFLTDLSTTKIGLYKLEGKKSI